MSSVLKSFIGIVVMINRIKMFNHQIVKLVVNNYIIVELN